MPITIKPMILSIGLLSLAASFTAQAAPVTIGNYTLDAESHTAVYDNNGDMRAFDPLSDPKMDAMANGNGSIQVYPNGAAYSGGSAYPGGSSCCADFGTAWLNAWGYDGNMGAVVYGAGASPAGYFGSASVNYSALYTNTSAVAQDFLFSFSVAPSYLGVVPSYLGFWGTSDSYNYNVAELLLRIRINGVDVALSQTTLMQDNLGGVSCTSNGLGLLADYMDCANASNGYDYYSNSYGYILGVDGQNYTLDLGLIGAGESFTLDYDIIAIAYGGGDAARGGSSVAQTGDPFDSSWVGLNGRFVDPNPSPSNVPEPSSVALFGLAFAGLAAIRRRRT